MFSYDEKPHWMFTPLFLSMKLKPKIKKFLANDGYILEKIDWFTAKKKTKNIWSFYVEIANTPAEYYRGLSGRKSLSSGTGMLFIFSDEHIRTFWMKDCYVPLDIAFISANWEIVSIETMAVWPEPKDPNQKQYSSDKPCKYALEVPAGELKNAGIKVGDKITAIF